MNEISSSPQNQTVPADPASPPNQASLFEQAAPASPNDRRLPRGRARMRAVPAEERPDGGLERSEPTLLEIPAIGVSTGVVPIGLGPDRTLDVPPVSGKAPASWYQRSPTPGETGSSVIVGHVDSERDGPAVFHHLRLLRPGDLVVVHRADGSVVEFAVTGVGRYPRTASPGELVGGGGDHPVLTLITGGGEFDRERRSYRDNLVVFARSVPSV